jgi:IMP dehydrogenase
MSCKRYKNCLSYDDVLLMPQFSDIESRSDINISSNLGKGIELALPLIASPMDTISEGRMAVTMASRGGTAIIHRYNSIEEQIRQVKMAYAYSNKASSRDLMIGAAVGVSGDYIERAAILDKEFVNFICVDVAHGHHSLVRRALVSLRMALSDDVHIMAGNVATLEGINDLADWGADSVRCNIGGGSICSTRIQTGHGMPGLQTIIECAKTDRDVKIIADGGIRNAGDIVKALAAGADAVMCGSLFAGTDETPGKVFQDTDGSGWKTYRGMASKEAQVEWRGRYNSFEGVATRVPYRGPVKNILNDLEKGIRSGLSYSGARSIEEFQSKAVFVQQTTSGLSESHTHITTRKW